MTKPTIDRTTLTDATGWCWSDQDGVWVGCLQFELRPIATVMTADTHAGAIIRAKGIQTKTGSVADVLDWLERNAPAATRMMSR